MIQDYPLTLIGGLFVLCGWYLITTTTSYSKLGQRNGCQLPKSYPHREKLLGLDYLRDSITARDNQCYLQREQQLHQQNGNTYRSLFLGQWVLNTIEPDNLRAILSTSFADYDAGARRRRAFKPLLGNSIFQSDGLQWRSARSLLQKCFAQARIDDLDLLEPHIQSLLAAIPDNQKILDLAPLFHRFAADVATDFLFGESLGSLSHPDRLESGLQEAFYEAAAGCEFRWLLGKLAFLWPNRAFLAHVRTVHSFIQPYVDKALQIDHQGCGQGKNEKGRPDFLSQLCQRPHDRRSLQDEITTLYFAGADTVAALLINLFFVLSKRPDAWKRVRIDIQHLRGQKPTLQQLKSLRYVNGCILESLRIHPPQASNSRIANKDTILPTGGGPDGKSPIFVSKGTMVHVATYALHRRRDLWGDEAEEFDPDRWIHQKQNWKFIPFLGGPRNCIGMDLAINEATYVLIRLAQEFGSIVSQDPNDWVESAGLALMSKNGVRVAMARKVIVNIGSVPGNTCMALYDHHTDYLQP
ncbi:cytochrome P450 [Aspergillus homomorphus CBS 101889]|uniref:Putative cytochrome P450 n=1 Tax=Aspergillus homomorphus (strain CBS 101889) TaxID=1450537 RepID=A0A395HSH5_ASPHC|nr:putative cytochrome P450 [Aspergillus homomorphus CBS 101889]RAL10373.1 putative cytochrome P450 [Aspergillus homomorphus CBS 101889]